MKIKLSDHFNYKKLAQFTLPSVAMMVFTSLYGIVDGFFVSNFTGKIPFAALNFIFPFLMVLGAIGSMLGAGGSALVAKTLGEGKGERANKLFSLFVWLTFLCGVALGALAFIFIEPITLLLGASEEMTPYCVLYGRIILLALPFQMLQFEFQAFFVTANKPQLGFWVTVIAGVGNMVLDALLVGIIPLGLTGAAIATAISQLLGGVIPIIYFLKDNDGLLRLVKPVFDGRALIKACANGSSEFLSNITMNLIGMLYNAQLMIYAGENGVAAYGVLMYVSFIFYSCFMGYSVGTAPLIGYNYGAENRAELSNLTRRSAVIIGISSVAMVILSEVLSLPMASIFVGYDSELLAITHRGFVVYSFTFLFAGISIFGSSFFTGLNNGAVSAVIAIVRTLVCQSIAVLVLPIFLGIDGVWLSAVVAELVSAIITVWLMIAKSKKYGYGWR